MLGNIAHQWRQPLAIINTVVAILDEKNSTDSLSKEEISEKLQSMQNRIIYMSDTIEDFMNYYRPDKAKSMFNISDAIEKSLDIVSFDISKDSNISINLDLNKNLVTYGLMNEFVQVIVTILSNVRDVIVEHSFKDKNIDINVYKKDNTIILSIADNCGGIDEKNLSKIFDPYFTTKHQSMGTGLGLYIARMIIEENMGAKISAQNINNGAKFMIEINDE